MLRSAADGRSKGEHQQPPRTREKHVAVRIKGMDWGGRRGENDTEKAKRTSSSLGLAHSSSSLPRPSVRKRTVAVLFLRTEAKKKDSQSGVSEVNEM